MTTYAGRVCASSVRSHVRSTSTSTETGSSQILQVSAGAHCFGERLVGSRYGLVQVQRVCTVYAAACAQRCVLSDSLARH